jgi:hypothetical protein
MPQRCVGEVMISSALCRDGIKSDIGKVEELNRRQTVAMTSHVVGRRVRAILRRARRLENCGNRV